MSGNAELGLPEGIRACLFDLDGVLAQTTRIHADAWRVTLDGFLAEHGGGTFDLERDYRRHVDGRRSEDGVRAFLSSRGIDLCEEGIEALSMAKRAQALRLLRERGVEAFTGSVRYLHAVARAGLARAVVSSSEHCNLILEDAGIAHLLEVRVDGLVAERAHLHGKPAPDTYRAAAALLGVRPAEAAVFEDAIPGVEAGRAGGFGYVVGVDRGGQLERLRAHGADVVVADLADLLAFVPATAAARATE